MTPRRLAFVELHVTILIMGGAALFPRLIALPADLLTVARSAIAMLAIGGFLVLTGTALRLPTRRLPWALLLGLMMGLHWWTFFYAIQLSSAGLGTLALFTFPVFTALLEPWLEKRRPRSADLVAAGVVLLGVAVLLPRLAWSDNAVQGVAWGVFSAFCYAARNVFTKRWFADTPGTVTMFWQLLVIAVLGSPLLFSHGAELLAPAILGKLLLLGLVFTAVGHVMFVRTLRTLRASTVSLISCLQPLYTVAMAYWILHETPGERTLLGGALILGAAAWEMRRASRDDPKLN